MTTWLVILAVGAGSYLLRVVPVLVDGPWSRSPKLQRTIEHAGTAALAALIAIGLHGNLGSIPWL